jgi:predicted nucleic acid-binding protein
VSVGLDTSVVLRLLTGEPREQAQAARAFVASSPSPVASSDLVVEESYFALRHHYAVPHGEALRALHALLSDTHVRSTGAARTVLAEMRGQRPSASQPGLRDHLIHGDYRRDALDTVTFDRAVGRLSGAELLA